MINDKPLCFLIADDHDIVKLGTKELLRSNFANAKILTADHFEQALHILQMEEVDVLILDINIPGGDKLSMISKVRKKRAATRIVMFSAYSEQIYALPYLRAGADGYVDKSTPQKNLLDAVFNVLIGKKHLSPEMQQANINYMLGQHSSSRRALNGLSSRELDVALLLTKGMNARQIGDQLALSGSAVAAYRNKVFQKLGIKNVLELNDFMRSHAQI